MKTPNKYDENWKEYRASNLYKRRRRNKIIAAIIELAVGCLVPIAFLYFVSR
jgi:hypothetical protein